MSPQEGSIKKMFKHFLFNFFHLGIKNTMVVRIGGINRTDVSSFRLDFVDTNGKILQANIVSDKLGSDDVRNATIIPP